jgi:hypothetical protein
MSNSKRFSLIQPGDVIRIAGERGNLTVDAEQPRGNTICLTGERGAWHQIQLNGEELWLIKNWGKRHCKTQRVSDFSTHISVAI